jgi:hypothetical protein
LVSAKTTYYNPVLDVINERTTELNSLDSVITTALYFFDFEDLEGYSLSDKKDILVELLRENTTLLVLDNFETIPSAQQKEIIRFFEVDVKHELRSYPNNFKVLITSREAIPSGFHSISLAGLDLDGASQLMSSLYVQYERVGGELSQEQKSMLHEATFGIPIVIKHAFGQIYELHRPFSSVVDGLPRVESQKLVDFSYQEILCALEKDNCALEILLLLELIKVPLMSRQIADILERSGAEVQLTLPVLEGYQCIQQRLSDEKYTLNAEIMLLTKKLLLDHSESAHRIRYGVTKNFTIEKQMEYTSDELVILTLFEEYIRSKQYLEGERFINEELVKRPSSILLRFAYSKYLKEERKQIERAIDILESIRDVSHNHISILRLLIDCYTSTDIPNYSRASVYVKEVEVFAADDVTLMLDIGKFYTRWSVSTKMSRDVSPDPISEMLRQQQYKDLADKGLVWLNQVPIKTHEVYYFMAQCYFNKWAYHEAHIVIQHALAGVKDSTPQSAYLYLKHLIEGKQQRNI